MIQSSGNESPDDLDENGNVGNLSYRGNEI
jgi:hypothetical protein